MSIPLVQNNDKDAINTSIIAIKRNIERINMLLGLVDSGSPDLSGLATKQELEDAITQVETDLTPVDEVTIDNMQSVTSNAVYRAFSGWEQIWSSGSGNFIQGIETPMGKFLRIRFNGLTSGYIANGTTIATITDNRYKPTINPNRFKVGVDTSNARVGAGIDYNSNGKMDIYFYGNTPITGGQTVSGIFCDVLLLLL
jgi:hypothetical protein